MGPFFALAAAPGIVEQVLRISEVTCENGEPRTTASTPRSITSFAWVTLFERSFSSDTRTLPSPVAGGFPGEPASKIGNGALEPARQPLLVEHVGKTLIAA